MNTGTLNIVNNKEIICLREKDIWCVKYDYHDYLRDMKPYKQKVIIGEINYNGPIYEEEKLLVHLNKLLRYKHDI